MPAGQGILFYGRNYVQLGWCGAKENGEGYPYLVCQAAAGSFVAGPAAVGTVVLPLSSDLTHDTLAGSWEIGVSFR